MTRCWILLLMGALLLAVPPARADEVEDAARLPFAEAADALGTLLRKAETAKDEAAQIRIRRALARVHDAAGDIGGGLVHLEALVDLLPKDVPLRVRYAGALLHVARANIEAGSMGRNVNPFLRDAADTLAKVSPKPSEAYSESVRASLIRIRAEAHFLLQEHAEALAVLKAADVGSLPEYVRAPLRDLEGRIHYARKNWAASAEAFLAAGRPLGAASAWDAARQPEKSIPLYAEALRGNPPDPGPIARALAAVRFHKAHAALYDALGEVAAPEGAAGIPWLRMQAELLEGMGRIEEALPLLRDASERNPADARSLVDLGRLQGVQAMSGDAVDEDRLDRSADAYIQALKRQPDSEAASGGLSWIASQDYSRLWRSWRNPRITDRCLRVQRALCEAVPDDAWAWGNLGNTLRVLGQTKAALEAYAKAREANPYDPGVRSDEGLALAAAGRPADALAAYLASLELDPGHLAGRQNSARQLYLEGKDDAAQAQLGAAIRTARAVSREAGTYRFLLERSWRASRRTGLR